MKKLLLILVALLIPSTGFTTEQKYWSCMQIGYIDDQRVVVQSDLMKNHWSDYKHREREYARVVKKTLGGKLIEKFEPSCLDYLTRAEAERTEKTKLAKVKEYGFIVIYIKFDYEGLPDVQKEK